MSVTALRELRCTKEQEGDAREGLCPGCGEPGFLGNGVDQDGNPLGSCLCKGCMTVWQYPLAARRHWKDN